MSILKSRYSTPEVPQDTTLIDIILENALKNGDKLALVSITLVCPKNILRTLLINSMGKSASQETMQTNL